MILLIDIKKYHKHYNQINSDKRYYNSNVNEDYTLEWRFTMSGTTYNEVCTVYVCAVVCVLNGKRKVRKKNYQLYRRSGLHVLANLGLSFLWLNEKVCAIHVYDMWYTTMKVTFGNQWEIYLWNSILQWDILFSVEPFLLVRIFIVLHPIVKVWAIYGYIDYTVCEWR